jgi:hypothetical protein
MCQEKSGNPGLDINLDIAGANLHTTSEITTTTLALYIVCRLERFFEVEEFIFVFKMR